MQACSQLYERGWVNEDKIIGEVQREVCCCRYYICMRKITQNNINNLLLENVMQHCFSLMEIKLVTCM